MKPKRKSKVYLFIERDPRRKFQNFSPRVQRWIFVRKGPEHVRFHLLDQSRDPISDEIKFGVHVKLSPAQLEIKGLGDLYKELRMITIELKVYPGKKGRSGQRRAMMRFLKMKDGPQMAGCLLRCYGNEAGPVFIGK
jgi:hypothetical protein